MSHGIFLIQGGGLVEMKEQQYDSEELLQKLLAEYPNLLAGEQMDAAAHRRWLLISREMDVPSEEEGTDRWAVDHLFLDQDAIPTLVKVKRSTDTRIRREVVGQMLDYAANAVVYWPVETIRTRFEQDCQQRGIDSAKELERALGPGISLETFWQRVKTNLQAGRVRMVFVADAIPPELRRTVEFLNSQMDPAEVLAVEIKQYTGESSGQQLKTLVPLVIGQTAEAIVKKGGSSGPVRQWDEASFFQELREGRGEKEAEAAHVILEWAKRSVPRIWWGKGIKYGSFYPMLDYKGENHWVISVWTYGRVEIPFQWMRTRRPFDDDTKRLELLERLNQIQGVAIPANAIAGRPSIPLASFIDPEALKAFLSVMEWYVAVVKAT
jgi:hypothetical protein